MGPLAVLSMVKSTYEGVSLSLKLEIATIFSTSLVRLDQISGYTNKFFKINPTFPQVTFPGSFYNNS